MNPIFLMRLVFDLVAAGLLLFAFSYWWLGNVAHELAGTAMFLLVIVHNVFNRRWYGTFAKTRRETRGLLNIVVTILLLVAMLALLVTSVLISNALSGIMSAYGGFTVRQIHTLAAYWVLVIVSVHLGLRWPMLMGVARKLSGIAQPNALRTLVLRPSPPSSRSTASGVRSNWRSARSSRCRRRSTGGISRNRSRAFLSTASRSPGYTLSPPITS